MRPKPLTKEQIQLAMRMTKSNKAAAKYLGVSYIHYKMWAKRYHEFEGGRMLFEIHKNQAGKGIPKHLSSAKQSQWSILDVINGTISPTHFSSEDLKKKLVDEGHLKEECAICDFHERRVNDYKIPLILDFKNNNANNYSLSNIRFLCYNCFFLNVGDIFNQKDIHHLETHQSTFGTSEAIDFQLDDYQKEQLARLGLYDIPKPEDDGSEFISRF